MEGVLKQVAIIRELLFEALAASRACLVLPGEAVVGLSQGEQGLGQSFQRWGWGVPSIRQPFRLLSQSCQVMRCDFEFLTKRVDLVRHKTPSSLRFPAALEARGLAATLAGVRQLSTHELGRRLASRVGS